MTSPPAKPGFGLLSRPRPGRIRVPDVLLGLALLLPWVLTGQLSAQTVAVQQRSEPAGVITQDSFHELGSVATTVRAPGSASNYRFTHWTLNGVRAVYPTGRAANPVSFPVLEPMEAVAHYLPEDQDSDGDGLPDWIEVYFFGDLSSDGDRDGDGDGFSNLMDLDRGYDPSAVDTMGEGGISRRGFPVVIDLGDPGNPDDDLDGFLASDEDFRGYNPAVVDRLSPGGISRRRSGPVIPLAGAESARLLEISDPAGVVNGHRVVSRGSEVSLTPAPVEFNGFRFTGWFVDGMRIDTPPLKQPTKFTVVEDTLAVARYVDAARDSDGDSIPDWKELWLYETLEHDPGSDPDGDGIAWADESFRGYSELIADTLVPGGISRRRSASIAVDTTGRIPYVFRSHPAGMVVEDGLGEPGSLVTTPDLRNSVVGDYEFAYWEVNGERQADPGGYSQPQASFVLNRPATAIAHYFRSAIDDDFDDIPDLYELRHFGTVGNSASSDPDDDGISVAGERFRGYQPQVRDLLAEGGISRRRTALIPVNVVELSVPPYITVNNPTQVTAQGARLNALINPVGLETTVYFEHGPTPDYGTVTPVQNAGSGTLPVTVGVDVSGLQPASVYHFRVVAENASGERTSRDYTFTTLWDPLVVAQGFEPGSLLGPWLAENGAWETGVPSAGPAGPQSGSASAGTLLGSDYPPDADSRFISPLFDVPEPALVPHLDFAHWWHFAEGDYGLVEVREGTTGVWRTLAAFTGESGGWLERSLDLTDFAGRRIQVSFRLVANGDDQTAAGWFLDAVRVVTGEINEWLADSPDPMDPGGFHAWWTATHPMWQSGTPGAGPEAAFEGDHCAGTVLNGTYPDRVDGRLISPLFRMPDESLNPRLRFWHWFAFGAGDAGLVEFRTPGGRWQTLDTISGSSGGVWSRPGVDLSGLAGQWGQISFRLLSDARHTDAGWYIDLPEIVTGPDILNNPETFDGDIGDWDTDRGGIWQFGRPASGPGAAFSGNNAAATNLRGRYPDNISARLQSPVIQIGDPGPGKLVALRFQQAWDFGPGDGGTVEISVLDGGIWSDWLPLASHTDSSPSWQESLINLNDYRGRTVRIGFLLTSDGDSNTGAGWYLDDIELTSLVRGTLTPGIALRSDLTRAGEAQYFELDLQTAGPLILNLDNAGQGNRLELFASRGMLPLRGLHDHADRSGPGATRSLLIPWAAPGKWYVMVHTDKLETAGSLVLQASPTPVVITGVTPESHASNVGMSMTIEGAGFANGLEVVLRSGAGVVVPADTIELDAFDQVTATFRADSIPVGDYDLVVTLPDGGEGRLEAAFSSLDPGGPVLETRLIMPQSVSPRAPATIYVEYTNTGTASMPAPLLLVRSTGGPNVPILTLDRSYLISGFWADTSIVPPGMSTEVAILASGEQAGILHPGESMEVPVYFVGLLDGWTDGTLDMEIAYWTEDDSAPMEWARLRTGTRPSTIAEEVWSTVFDNLTSQLETTGDYVRMLNSNAGYLGRLGHRVLDVNLLWDFELQQAFGISPISHLDQPTDLLVPSPGTDLVLDRGYSTGLPSRSHTGIFGRGWFNIWETRLVAEQEDEVVRIVGEGGSSLVYSRDSRDGSFFSLPGDSARLLRLGGGHELRFSDGSAWRFNSSGQLGYTQDSNGNRITASYRDNQLIRLDHSSGAFIELVYNSSGRVTAATDSLGRSVTYQYSGDRLTAVISPDDRTTSYQYQSTGPAASINAMTSITHAGVTTSFEWDDLGRLTRTWTGDPENESVFIYGDAGSVTTANAAGQFTIFIDHWGLPVKLVDPLGQVTQYEYGQDRRLARQVMPSGDSRSYTWCSCGSPSSITDELGNVTRFEYKHPLRRMTALIDAKGNRTTFEYDASGNLKSTTYSDGSVHTVGNYDEAGLPHSVTNRRGQTTLLKYNALGQLEERQFHDGRSEKFEYDQRANLIATTETTPGQPEKRTTYAYGAGTDGDQLRRVTYPDGQWIEFAYDEAGRRSRVSDSLGGDMRYVYDGAGRPAAVRDADNVDIVRYEYDNASRLSRTLRANGTWTTYEYDAAGQILKLAHHDPLGAITSQFEYLYDQNGRRTIISTRDGIWNHSFDATGQLTRAIFSSINPDIPDQDLNYEYDPLGNRIATVINGATTKYAVNNLNQYSSVDGIPFSYDADGNLVDDGQNRYSYNSLNLLTGISGPDGDFRYEYDALGNRVAMESNGSGIRYLVDPVGLSSAVAQNDLSTGDVTHFIHGLGMEADVSASSGSISFHEFDAVGSLTSMTGPAGEQLFANSYLPFGGLLHSSSTLSQTHGFLARFGIRNESPLSSYVRARSYSPALGRFLQQDPTGIAGGDFNLYRYAANQPNLFVDVNGRIRSTIKWSIGKNNFLGGTVRGLIEGLISGKFSLLGGLPFSGFLDYAMDPNNAHELVNNTHNMVNLYVDYKCGGPGYRRTHLGLGEEAIGSLPPGCPVRPPGSPNSPGGGAGSGQSGGGGSSPVFFSMDPNEKLPPGGGGAANWVSPDGALPYTINFENIGPGSEDENGDPYPTFATAPAQRVVITDQLAAEFDWTSFRVTELGFGDVVISVPGDTSHFATTVPMTYQGVTFDVEVDAGIDFETGEVRVVFQSIEPGLGLPPPVEIGFLPPEDGTRRGMGHVSYLIQTRPGLPVGTAIRNIAVIRFDINEVIATNQVDPQDASKGTDPDREALITLDGVHPEATILAVAGEDGQSVEVAWSGDDHGGSGIQSYDIYVSVGNGPFQPWLTGTTLNQSTYRPISGQAFIFRAAARDYAGNQSAPVLSDTVQIDGGVGDIDDDYLRWKLQHFGSALFDRLLENSLWGDFADPDEDDRRNIGEFLAASNPLVADAGLGPQIIIADGQLTYRYRNTLSTNNRISRTIQWSPDGITWFEVEAPVEVVESHPGHQVLQFTIPNNGQPDAFIRELVSRDVIFPHWIFEQGAAPGQRGPDDDPNGDFISNALAYALDVPAVSPLTLEDREKLPAIVLSAGADNGVPDQAGVRFAMPEPLESDVRLILEASPSLAPGSWEFIASMTGDGSWELSDSFRLSVTKDDAGFTSILEDLQPARFYRLRAEVIIDP